MNYNLQYIRKSGNSTTINRIKKSYFIKKRLECTCYNQAYVLPINQEMKGGVVDRNLKEIKASPIQQIKGQYSFETNQTRKEKSAILLATFTTYTWGHCFTDHFSKLWFLQTEQCKKLIKDGATLIYISINNKKPPQYVCDLFMLAGVDLSNARCIENITQYDYLYIPDDSFFSGIEKEPRFFTKEYENTIETVRRNVYLTNKNLNVQLFPKIYLTRTQGKNFSSMYRDLGEKVLDKVFKRLGYQIIAPEKFSVNEQIWLLMNCKELATTEGSIAHTAIFCNQGTNIVLIKKCNWISMHQLVVNEVAKLNVTYIDAHHSCFCDKKEPWHGPFFMCITKELQNYVGHRILHIPYFLSPSFFIYCAREIYVKSFRKIQWIDKYTRKFLK